MPILFSTVGSMWMRCLGLLVACIPVVAVAGETPQLTGNAQAIYERAQQQPRFKQVAKLNPTISPTSDEQSFWLAWTPSDWKPRRWVVSLHGSRGYATDDLAIWRAALRDRNMGFIALQWWIGTDDKQKSYYSPEQIYRELDNALKALNVEPGSALLHGFNRGSSNLYAVAALDAGHAQHYFSLFVASSGGVVSSYPPNKAIVSGDYGDHPLRNTHWITAAGDKDPNPNRDGIPGMQKTTAWLEKQGAIVFLNIEDPKLGHGALLLNPKNIKRVLDYFGE